MNYFDADQEERYKNDLYQELYDRIDGILSENASQQEKNELLDSLIFIFEQHIAKLQNEYREFLISANLVDTNIKFPLINLYLPTNFGNQTGYNFSQHPSIPIMVSSQNNINYSYSVPIQPTPQFYQNPNILFYNQPYILSTPSPKPSKKVHLKKTKPKHKSTKKEDKKHHTKKSSQKVEKPLKIVGIVKNFVYDSSREFNGIIRYLKDSNQENAINITTSSTYKGFSRSMDHQNVLLLDNSGAYFSSDNRPNSWICLDFTKYRIIPSCYTLMSIPYEKGNFHPKSWAFEASNDKQNWVMIDSRRDCHDIDGNSLVSTFNIANRNEEKMRYFRVRQTDRNCGGNDFLEISAIEIYGQLFNAE